jgi:hypothetical protein
VKIVVKEVSEVKEGDKWYDNRRNENTGRSLCGKWTWYFYVLFRRIW